MIELKTRLEDQELEVQTAIRFLGDEFMNRMQCPNYYGIVFMERNMDTLQVLHFFKNNLTKEYFNDWEINLMRGTIKVNSGATIKFTTYPKGDQAYMNHAGMQYTTVAFTSNAWCETKEEARVFLRSRLRSRSIHFPRLSII